MSGAKILIVDDDRSIADLLKLHLEEEGYAVLTAQSVDKALALIETASVDLVMLDIRMPGKDGFDFLRAVATHHGRPRMPVVVMTGRGELQSLFEGMAVDGFVNKPFEMPLVIKTVKQALESKKKTVYLADAGGSELARTIAEELRDERYQVFFIKDPAAFKDRMLKLPADYIVMEYEQHSSSGEAMILEMRSVTAVPIIVYSASGMDFRDRSLAAGASLYLGRPETPAAIVTAIRGFEMK